MGGSFMLCGNGRLLSGTLSWLAHGCSAFMGGVWVGIIMVGPWLRGVGWRVSDFIMVGPWMDALR